MGELAKRVFFVLTLSLLIMCTVCVFIAERGTAEYFILLLAAIINCFAVLVQLIVKIVKGKK